MIPKSVTRRDMLKLAGITAAGTVVAACQPQVVKETVVVEKVVDAAPAPRQPTTIVLMYHDHNFTPDERKLFEEKYPPYKIDFIPTDLTKMMAMFASGQQLDVFREQGVNCPALVMKRLPLDLTDYFEVSEVLKADDIIPVNDYYVVHGRRYGMVKDWSFDFNTWIRKDFLEEAGIPVPGLTESVNLTTWREWAKKLTKREGDRVLSWGMVFPQIGRLIFEPATYATPGGIFTEDFTKANILNDPENYEAAKFGFEWVKEGGLASILNPYITGKYRDDFQAGVAAALVVGYWFAGSIMNAEWDLNENLLMLPAPGWGPTYSNVCRSGTGTLVSASTRVPDAAFKLFEYFSGEEPAEGRAKTGWGIPGLHHLMDLLPRDEPWRKQTYDQVMWDMENSEVLTWKANPYVTINSVGSTWAKYEESALRDEITFDEMLQNIETDVDELIREGMDRAGL